MKRLSIGNKFVLKTDGLVILSKKLTEIKFVKLESVLLGSREETT